MVAKEIALLLWPGCQGTQISICLENLASCFTGLNGIYLNKILAAMENFEKCSVAILWGPCSQHVTGNTSPLNQPQSAIIHHQLKVIRHWCGYYFLNIWNYDTHILRRRNALHGPNEVHLMNERQCIPNLFCLCRQCEGDIWRKYQLLNRNTFIVVSFCCWFMPSVPECVGMRHISWYSIMI